MAGTENISTQDRIRLGQCANLVNDTWNSRGKWLDDKNMQDFISDMERYHDMMELAEHKIVKPKTVQQDTTVYVDVVKGAQDTAYPASDPNILAAAKAKAEQLGAQQSMIKEPVPMELVF